MLEILSLLGSSELGKWLVGGLLALAVYARISIKARRDGAAAERARQAQETIRAHETRTEAENDTAQKPDAAVRDALAGWVPDQRRP